ncbi:MAG TPA: type II toxin-antitoxin system MqsA family antitoxin [Tepidiformaceae bacterium]
MGCTLCRTGRAKPGEATVTLQRGGTTVIIKAVPADVCDNCGEYYLSEEVSERLMDCAEAAVRRGAEVEILRYTA